MELVENPSLFVPDDNLTVAHLVLTEVPCEGFLGRRFELCGPLDWGPESSVRNCEHEALGNVREEEQSL